MSQWTRDEGVSANASKSRTPAWASYCARDWRLAASSPADGARIGAARERSLNPRRTLRRLRFRLGRPAMPFDRQSDRTLASPSCTGFRTTLSCQHRIDLRLAKHAARVFNQTRTYVWRLRVRICGETAHGSRIARMPWYVSICRSRDRPRTRRCAEPRHVLLFVVPRCRPSRRRNAIP